MRQVYIEERNWEEDGAGSEASKKKENSLEWLRIPLSPMYVPYPPRAPLEPTWPTNEWINGKTEYASLTPNGVSREFSTFSFCVRKLGGENLEQTRFCEQKLDGENFEQREKEVRINAGRNTL